MNALSLDLSYLNTQFEASSPAEILRWVWKTFGNTAVASSSFQTQSVPLLHIISQTCPELPVIFLDTGFHFPETLTFRDELVTQLGLNLVIAQAAVQKSQQVAQYGEGLYRRDPDLCCYISKVEPMRRVTTKYKAWISGVRRDQTANRQSLSVFDPQATNPLKIHPMLNWTKAQVWNYIDEHQLPSHPLFTQGYPSVGCAPCTRPIFSGEDERAGRWTGTGKTECGLHLTDQKETF